MGPNGLRAGWRLLIFFAILVPLGIGAGRIIDLFLSKLQADMYTPLGGLAVMGTLVIALLLASNIMARIERRRIADFGLPWRRAFCGQFWQGAAISFSSLTALLLVLWLAGAFSFGSLALHGADIWKYGVLWTLPLFLSAVRRFLVSRLPAVHADQRHRLLASGRRHFASNGRGALL
jgi:hypothetical protein